MMEVDDILKNAVFTDEEHKKRLYSELFDKNVISYKKHIDGGTKMSEEKKIFDPNLENELTDDDLDNAAAGIFVTPKLVTDTISRAASSAVFVTEQGKKKKAKNTIFLSGGPGGPSVDPNGPMSC